MTTEPAELLRDALSLPAEARAALVDSLLERLDATVDDDSCNAWKAEINRPLRQMNNDVVQPIPWDDARKGSSDSQTRVQF